MASYTGAAVVAVALVTAVTACGGGGSSEPRMTLTDSGCSYQGDTTVNPGTFTIKVENRTKLFGAFAIAAIADASKMEDLKAYITTAERQLKQTGKLPEPPAYYRQVVRSGVTAGSTSDLPVDVSTGTYALMCFVDNLPTWRAYVADKLDVSG